MATRQFDALFIDFYGTITAGDRDAVAVACRNVVDAHRLPTTAEAFAIEWGETFFALLDESNHDSFRTLHECELTSLRKTLAAYDRDGDVRRLVAPIESYWTDPPLHGDVMDFFAWNPLPICCVSNADHRPLQIAIARHGLSFDAVISSERTRCYKPDPAIFETALETMGVRADRALHVGDSLHSDIAGAANAGLTTVWIHRRNRIHDIGRCRPDHTINALTELAGIIGG